jgi:uncharacterized OsmC-like protein
MATPSGSPRLNGIRIDAVGELVHAILGDEQKAQTTPSVNVTWNGGFRSEAQIRQLDPVPSDAPVGFGGDDTAPTPVEQLLGALGNCLAVGYATNASAAGIEIHTLNIKLEGDLDLQAFLGLCNGNAGYGGITAEVYLDSNASAEEPKDLHEKVTGSSPVGQTLIRPVPVTIELAEPVELVAVGLS